MTVFGILLLSDFVEGKFVFALVAIVSTFLPDVDNARSYFGRKKIFRPVQGITKHRGFLHSFTFMGIAFIILYLWIPVVSYGFLLGYGVHLLGDSFTKRGVKFFWPLKWKIKGKMRSGRGMEIFIFLAFLIMDVFLLLYRVLRVV
jgi:inner membrane protein